MFSKYYKDFGNSVAIRLIERIMCSDRNKLFSEMPHMAFSGGCNSLKIEYVYMIICALFDAPSPKFNLQPQEVLLENKQKTQVSIFKSRYFTEINVHSNKFYDKRIMTDLVLPVVSHISIINQRHVYVLRLSQPASHGFFHILNTIIDKYSKNVLLFLVCENGSWISHNAPCNSRVMNICCPTLRPEKMTEVMTKYVHDIGEDEDICDEEVIRDVVSSSSGNFHAALATLSVVTGCGKKAVVIDEDGDEVLEVNIPAIEKSPISLTIRDFVNTIRRMSSPQQIVAHTRKLCTLLLQFSIIEPIVIETLMNETMAKIRASNLTKKVLLEKQCCVVEAAATCNHAIIRSTKPIYFLERYIYTLYKIMKN